MSVLGSLLKDVIWQRKNSLGSQVTVTSDPVQSLVEAGLFALKAGDLWGAKGLYEKALASTSDDEALQRLRYEIEYKESMDLVSEKFPGKKSLDWLAWFHQFIVPTTYLEIGVESGQFLQFAMAPTRAVGVDNELAIIYTQRNWVKLFRLTSEDFFLTQNVPQVFGHVSIGMAFINGRRNFDQALKDFINIERHSSQDTVVLLHDVFPILPLSAHRERSSKFWVGDTWKIIWILHKYRPDLHILTLPTGPSGLGVITNLNKGNTTLQKELALIIQEAMALDFSIFTNEMHEFLHVVENDFDAMSRRMNDKRAKPA